MGDLHQTLDPFRTMALEALAAADPAIIDELLANAQRRTAGVPELQEALTPIRGLVRDYVHGEFERADDDEVAWALAAILYVITPWDLAPDHLPGGLRDDDRIVRAVTETIGPVLREYGSWVHLTRRSYRAERRPA